MSANNQSGAGSKMDNVSFIEAVNHYWALILAGIGLIVWLVRLEGKVSYAEGNIQAANGRIDTLATKHDSLDSKLVAQLSDVRESLARIEGRLGVSNKGDRDENSF